MTGPAINPRCCVMPGPGPDCEGGAYRPDWPLTLALATMHGATHAAVIQAQAHDDPRTELLRQIAQVLDVLVSPPDPGRPMPIALHVEMLPAGVEP